MEVTEREFQMLYDRVSSIDTRITTMDTGGTRGIGALVTKIDDLKEDFAKHELEHDKSKATVRNLVLLVVAEILSSIGQYIYIGIGHH